MALHSIAAVILAVATQTSQPPAADTTATTAAIRGRVVDRESGAPIAGANVRLDFLGPGTQKRLALTASDGAYAFVGLPPGAYNLLAEPAAGTGIYLSQRYGQSERVDPASDLTSGITLAAGDDLPANIELSKALSIEGHVSGDQGEPMPRIRMDLARLDRTGSAVPIVTTDERGAFRLSGVRPGEYRVCADPGLNFALVRTPGRFEGEHPIRTCYRRTSTADGDAVSISTASLTGVDITLRRTRFYSVSGTAFDSAGKPLAGSGFDVRKRDRTPLTSIDTSRTPDGHFVVRGVPPGEYEIRAWTGMANEPAPIGREIGWTTVNVTSADIEDIVVRTSRPVSVAGRVEFEGGLPSQRPSLNINFARRQIDTVSGFRPPVHVGQDLRFTLDGIFGPVALRVFGGMRPWVVKAINYRGQDVYGRMVEFRNSDDPNDLVVVLTDKGAAVSGHVAAPVQGPRPNAMVFLVAVGTGGPEPFLVTETSAAVEKDGTYRVPLVRAGEYLLFALPADRVGPGLWAREPEAVARFARAALRITLGENDDRSVDLKLIESK